MEKKWIANDTFRMQVTRIVFKSNSMPLLDCYKKRKIFQSQLWFVLSVSGTFSRDVHLFDWALYPNLRKLNSILPEIKV